jgi:S1-C subfamily serine protease
MITLSVNRITASSVSASNFDLVFVYTKLKESVVSITDTLPDNNNSNANTTNIGNSTDIFTNNSGTTGTGFVYDTKGHIITSLGVVTGTHVQQVEFSDGTIYDAKVIGSDPYSDIAVLLVEDVPIDKLKPVEFITNSSDVLIGKQTATIGNHFDSKGLLSDGIISGIHQISSIE